MKQFLFYILLFITSISYGQTWDYSYTHYGKEDGLPSNTVYCVTSDKDGVLWIGTDNGITRFDGCHFKTFTTQEGLPTNDIFHILCDSKNRIWVTGMSKYIAFIQNGNVHTKENDTLLNNIELKSTCTLFKEDNFHSIWIGSQCNTVFKIDSLNHVFSKSLPNTKDGGSIFINFQIKDSIFLIRNNDNVAIINNKFFTKKNTDSLHKIFIKGIQTIGDTIYYIESKSNKLKKISLKNVSGFQFVTRNMFSSLYKNSLNELYYLNNKGVEVYNKNNIENLKNKCLEDYSILNTQEDNNNYNWFCTNGNGLFKLNVSRKSIYKNDLQGTSNRFHSVCVTNRQIFVGDNNCKLSVLTKTNPKYSTILKIEKTNSTSFRLLKIGLYKNKLLIIATDNGVYGYDLFNYNFSHITLKGSVKNFYIKGDSIMILHNQGFENYNLLTHQNNKKNFNKRFYSYLNFNHQEIMGTEDGLYLFKDNNIIPFTLNEYFTNRVMDMTTYHDSLLVLATINSGVYFIDKHKIVRKLNTKNGLSSDNCFKILPYKQTYIIATSNGINIYNYDKNTNTKIFESDGLASNTVNDVTIDNDTLYAATENGLSIIPLNNLTINRNFILFNKPTIVGNDTLWTRDSTFTTRTNKSFVLFLNSWSFGTKGEVQYFYKYESGDTVFHATKDQSIPLLFTSPNDYMFEAYAVDANKNESNHIKIYIHVKPYFWQTWWFKLLMILLSVGIIYYLLLFYSKRIKAKADAKQSLDAKMQGLELSAWRSKINPHFLFNSLNSVNALIKTERYHKAISYIDRFSSILRHTIEYSNKIFNTIEFETSYIEQYLMLEMIKRDNHFTYHISFENENLKTYFIPSLLLQPVIENCIKHGIKAQEDGHISIVFSQADNHVKCIVSDNGKGIEKEALQPQFKSMGIKLIEEKISIIESIIKQKISFSMTYKNPENKAGAITTFIFPILKTNIYDSNPDH